MPVECTNNTASSFLTQEGQTVRRANCSTVDISRQTHLAIVHAHLTLCALAADLLPLTVMPASTCVGDGTAISTAHRPPKLLAKSETPIRIGKATLQSRENACLQGSRKVKMRTTTYNGRRKTGSPLYRGCNEANSNSFGYRR